MTGCLLLSCQVCMSFLAPLSRAICNHPCSADTFRQCDAQKAVMSNRQLDSLITGFTECHASLIGIMLSWSLSYNAVVAKSAFGAVTGAMTVNAAPLAPSTLTASIASPVLVQVPQVPAVHAVTLNAPPLSGSAATAVAAAVAQQELRQQQIIQQVKLCRITSCPVALSFKAADTCTQ